MIGRAVAVADCQAMPNGLRDVGLRRLCGIQNRTTSGKVRGQRRGKRTAGAMGMACLDELPLQDIEEPAVVEEIRRPFAEQMASFDQHVLAPESMDDLCGSSCIGQGGDLNSRQLLSLVDVWSDHKRERKQLRLYGVDGIRS